MSDRKVASIEVGVGIPGTRMNCYNQSNPCDAALAELLTLTVEVNSWGTTIYRNHLGQLHRVHGPAVIYPNGTHWWIRDNQRHRTDGPAVLCPNGDTAWWLNDERLTEEQWNERVKSL